MKGEVIMNKTEKVNKKDLIFTFIILQLLLIIGVLIVSFIFVKTTDSATLINQISLVSGVTSIILAFVAIIYAFFQSYSSGRQNKSLENLLSKVSDKVDEIGPLKKEVVDSKKEITQFLSKLDGSLAKSFQQFDKQIKNSGIEMGSNAGEIYQHFVKDYLQSIINDVNLNSTLHEKNQKVVQDFHVILTPKKYQANAEFDEDIADEYLEFFSKETSIWTIGSNVTVYTQGMGLSFTLSVRDNREWTAQEIKKVIDKKHHNELIVFTVAKLIY